MVAEAILYAKPVVRAPRSSTVRAKVSYVRSPQMDEELYVYKYELPKGIDTPSNLEFDDVEVSVTDLRTVEDTHFDIVRNGFQLERFQVPTDISWEDDKDVNRRISSTCMDQ